MLPVRLSNGHVIRIHRLDGAGTPLVFLHGLGCASSSDYPAVVASAPLTGKQAVLVDLLGYGFSDKPQNFDYSIAAQAETVVELLTLLDLRRVHLYGHSMGGSVAIAAATLAKHFVCSLVLSEPNLDPGGGSFSRSIAEQHEADYVQAGHAQNIADAIAADNLAWAGSMSVASALAVHRSAVSLVNGTRPTWRSELHALDVQRTVLFGEQSLPDDDFVALPRAGIGVGMVKGAGHSMAWESPASLALCIALSISEQSAA